MANATIDGAAYFVDNDNPVSFDLSPSDANSPVLLFETPQLPYGNHKLMVVYHTNVTANPPFILNALIVRNGTAPLDLSNATYPNPATPIFTATATPTLISSPESTATSGPSRQKLAPIVGGVIGGLIIFLALVLLASYILLRRRRRKNNKANAPVLLHNLSRKGKIAPHPKRTASLYRPPPPPSTFASSSPCLSYTSRSEYPQEQHASVNGYWDAISLDRRTRGNSMAPSPWDDGLAENGLLQRPEGLRSSEGSDAQAGRMSSNPAVSLEAHKRALRQLLGIGPSIGSPDGLRPVVDDAVREDEDAGRSRWSESTIKPSVLERAPKSRLDVSSR
jgi:hypothetical protein